jgi:protein-S-isoprenylcysteine O-methyltransferase Ste14
MVPTVALLRALALLAAATPMFVPRPSSRPEKRGTPDTIADTRRAVSANLGAFVVFFAVLFVFSGSTHAAWALAWAASGCAVALTGAVVVWKSRVALGPAWSLVPKAGEQTGLITNGPYRLVRHPIYLGFSLVATGQAVAFSSVPALLVVVICVIPSFVWRAVEEERVLMRVFGEHFVSYRKQTKMIVPYVL